MRDNNEHKCPLCGKETHPGDKFCEDCKQIVQNEYLNNQRQENQEDIVSVEKKLDKNTDNFQSSNFNLSADEIKTSDKSKTTKFRKLLTVFFIGIFLLIIAGGVSAYYMRKEKKESKDADIAFWMNCADENTTLSYSKYLIRYPDGVYSKEAQVKILMLRNREDSVWNNISKTTDPEKLYSFLADYPNTIYKDFVRNLIDSLTWIAMSHENTASSYKTYLDNIIIDHYEGKYKDEAQKRFDFLSQLTDVDSVDTKIIRDNLRNFLRMQSAKRYDEMGKLLASQLTDFEGQKNKSPKEIIDSIKRDAEHNKILSIVYRTTLDSVSVLRGKDSIYYATFNMSKEVKYANQSKLKGIILHKVNAELTPQKQIRALYMVGNQ